MHQTLLKSIGIHAVSLNMELIKNCPSFLQSLNKHIQLNHKFLEIDSNASEGDTNPQLVYINLKYPNMHLHYNIPLRNHSDILILIIIIALKNLQFLNNYLAQIQQADGNCQPIMVTL